MISMDLNTQSFLRYLSIGQSRCVSFSASRKKFKATNKRNVHQNPAMTIFDVSRMLAYLSGSNIARLNADNGLMPAMIATMSNGKSILIPNTAIAIHRVRNLFCRFGLIFLSTVAFTTALSNDSDTSSTARMSTMKMVCNHPAIWNACPAPRKNAIMTAMMVNINEPLKCFMALELRN